MVDGVSCKLVVVIKENVVSVHKKREVLFCQILACLFKIQYVL